MSELTITALRFGFLLLLWVLIFSIVSAMRRDLMVGRKAASGNGGGSRNGHASSDGDGLEDLSVEELRERAKQARIRGRSKMKKEELVEALHAA